MIEIENPQPGTIRFERLLDAPIETVWRYLSDTELRARWFAGGPLEPKAGGTIELHFDHDKLSSDDVPYPPAYAGSKGHRALQTVLAYDPPHRLAFTFEGEDRVDFALSAEGTRTRLVLTHSGIQKPANIANFGGGWHSHLAVLQKVVTGGSVRDFWALHAESEAKVKAALGGQTP